MTGGAERQEHDRLLQLVEDYVRAVSANGQVALENLTICQANLDLSYDISHPRPDFCYPPLVATLRSAVATYGPAEVERHRVELRHLRKQCTDQRDCGVCAGAARGGCARGVESCVRAAGSPR